ncbi:C-X-C motif chemokine 11-1 precursor [Danio rerio]|uniref:C-X-C motif chemokine 11-1 n=2 Tax=Danio rerio TaxID=7955 RepID=CX111_DANRE|nr:C-X-C motif chemokine 11-1 precursor [Danio rerio]A0A0R4INB9.1 RecName: Full=C-X-C motif chemokine 11-1; Flags: Precursor [Danio rerio]|eukprot:XP_001339307.1 C-X-C motif chemokine 11-1 [Danio rerio]
MKTVTALLLVSLAVVAIEGQHMKSQRCVCLGAGLNMVKPVLIEKIEILPSSPSCGHMEVIATLKNGAGKRCLNPKSKFTKKIIDKIEKNNRNAR